MKFKSITESFLDITDTSSHSKFIVNMFAALAQLERDIIIERTKAGLESARRRRKILGAPKESVRKINKNPYFAFSILMRENLRVMKYVSDLKFRELPIINI